MNRNLEDRIWVLWEPVYGEGFEVHSWWENDEQADEETRKLKEANPECPVIRLEYCVEVLLGDEGDK